MTNPASTTSPVTFGILGAAHYHAQHWLTAATANPAARVIGVWDSDPDTAREVADQFGIEAFITSTELLDQCDAVGIASQTVEHRDLAIAAANAGVNMLVEKPMARSIAECDDIIEAVDRNSVIYMQNFPKRYDAAHRELVEAVAGGNIGDLVAIRIRHGNDLKLGGRYSDPGWYADIDAAGGGALLDEGVHAADLLLWIAGLPQRVAAISDADPGDPRADLTSMATYQYDDGPLSNITASHAFTAGEASVEVFGTKGTATLSGVDLTSRDYTEAPYLKFLEAGTGNITGSDTIPGFVSGRERYHGTSIDRFIEVLTTGSAVPVGPGEARDSVAMVEAAYESARTGRTVDIPTRPSTR